MIAADMDMFMRVMEKHSIKPVDGFYEVTISSSQAAEALECGLLVLKDSKLVFREAQAKIKDIFKDVV